ncbi:MAG: TolC family protein [Chitinophagaceae bacterium]|nr:TolC family protein [Chitinophagaceae bacterium]
MFKRTLKLILLGSMMYLPASSQDLWDLQRAVEYALANNISVKQQDLQVRFSNLTLKQSRSSQLPSLNAGTNVGYRFGLTENPTTGVLEDNKFFSGGLNLQSGVDLFNWFSKRNAIEADRYTLEADKEQVKKIQNDVALNVAVAYLQVLLAKEQANISSVQILQTRTQLNNTRSRVDAGALPELNAVELEAQLARDSAAFVASQASVNQFILQLKALLNLDAAVPFDIVTPPVDMIPVEPLAELQPERVYALALANLPQQRVNALRIQAAGKTVEAARGAMYPNLGAFGSLGSNFVNFKERPIYNQVITGYAPSGLKVDLGGGTIYDVQRPLTADGTTVITFIQADPLGDQLRQNFGQSIGLNLSIPLFNGRNARTNWEKSQINVEQLQLQNQESERQLKQDIYAAYNDAVAAIERFNANQKSVEAAQRTMDFATKRYDLGLLSTFEMINSQNNLQRARIDMIYAQYDYVFKVKLLEFYKGQGLKL